MSFLITALNVSDLLDVPDFYRKHGNSYDE